MALRPVASVPASTLPWAEHVLVLDAAWASLTGAWSGGVVLVAFALALGAGPLTIGLLAALPIAAQAAQLPAIALIERVRQRKRIGVLVITASRVVLLGQAAIPFVADRQLAVLLLVIAQAVIAIFGSIGACCVNSWLHQLVPVERVGPFYARRLLWSTLVAGAGTLVAGQWIDSEPDGRRLVSFALVFLASALASFASSYFLAQAPEPQMHAAATREPLLAVLKRPLGDGNFRALLVFLAAWAAASNIAAPFLTVYLMHQLDLSLRLVTVLGVGSQLANAFALYLWGRLSTRVSNKSVLAAALPVYFVCTAALVLAPLPEHPWLMLSLLMLLHVLMGAATGGIALASGNLGLKLAPQGQGTAYLAVVGIVSAVAGGIAPLLAGAIGEWGSSHELSMLLRWQSPLRQREILVLSLEHWQFLFLLSAAAGLYVLHALSRVRENGEPNDRRVVQKFAIEAARAVGNVSSIGGAWSLFVFRRFNERRGLSAGRLHPARRRATDASTGTDRGPGE